MRRSLANVSGVELGLMRLSGLVLVRSRWGGPGGQPRLFRAKLVFSR